MKVFRYSPFDLIRLRSMSEDSWIFSMAVLFRAQSWYRTVRSGPDRVCSCSHPLHPYWKPMRPRKMLHKQTRSIISCGLFIPSCWCAYLLKSERVHSFWLGKHCCHENVSKVAQARDHCRCLSFVFITLLLEGIYYITNVSPILRVSGTCLDGWHITLTSSQSRYRRHCLSGSIGCILFRLCGRHGRAKRKVVGRPVS